MHKGESRLHFWLSERGVTMKLYELENYGVWHFIHREAGRIAASLNNLIDWFPFVWRDRDFDHSFLLNVMIFKLERMAKHFKTHQFTVGWEDQVAQIEECIMLLKRVEEDNYLFEYSNFQDAEDAAHTDLYRVGHIFATHLRGWWD